jgi:hypothetical protein
MLAVRPGPGPVSGRYIEIVAGTGIPEISAVVKAGIMAGSANIDIIGNISGGIRPAVCADRVTIELIILITPGSINCIGRSGAVG